MSGLSGMSEVSNQFDVICMGMALVDSIIKGFDPEPISASGYRAQSGTLSVGGEAVNEVVSCSRLGLKTGIACSFGDDAAAGLILSLLRNENVDTSCSLSDPSMQTPVSTLIVKEDGTRKSITNLAHRDVGFPMLKLPMFTGAKAWILGSLFRAPFDDAERILNVVSAGSSAGVKIYADTKLPNFKKLSLADLKESLPLIDFITPNEDEAKYLTGKKTPSEMADVFLSYGVKNVVIKLGAKGCFYKNSEKTIELPACPVEAVDATGAGDAFVAGLVTAILRGSDIEKALRFANTCGAVCCTKVGATSALRDLSQVRELVSRY